MTNSTESFYITLSKLLTKHHLIAHLWGVEDVQIVHDDLSDDQAWLVLQECDRDLDSECGLTWDHIDEVAARLFPLSEGNLQTAGGSDE